GMRDKLVTGVQTCALPISTGAALPSHRGTSKAALSWSHRPDGPHFHRAVRRARAARRPGERAVQIGRLDEVEAGELLLGLGEREIGRASCRGRVEYSLGAA